MYTRTLSTQERSFFLFGPRGTGKTTLLRKLYPKALWFNLLRESDYLPLLSDTEAFRARVESAPPGWVVIDEVQRIPNLLDQVHDLISLDRRKYRFALSGSSARKLRRLNVNLLAGRVSDRRLFPLTSQELSNDFDLETSLAFGNLPVVWDDRGAAVEILEAYVSTYLREEIQQEALVKDLGSFHRFLKVAAQLNGEILNIASVARDCSVARPTVQRYFETLNDTLIGFMLPAWQPRMKVRESMHPRFYFFDTGVVRAVRGLLHDGVADDERGRLLETFLVHEIRAAMSYQEVGGEISYWRSGASEIDLIYSRGKLHIGFEFKSSTTWRREYGSTVADLVEAKKLKRGYVIYRGKKREVNRGVVGLPVQDFLELLHSNKLFTERGA